MDLIVSSALEEICSQGQNGLVIHSLWSKLEPSILASNLDLSNGVKSAIWTQLLSVPSIQFEVKKEAYNAKDPSIQYFEDAERLNLKIVAKEHLRDNFVGLYNVQSANSNMSTSQRRVLERLAIARKNGVTQCELAKEFGIEGRNFFYVVKSLESQGLIVRHSAVIRTKEASRVGESRTSSIVSTNLMCLYRYAKHLGCQQKFEITKEENYIEHLGDPVETSTVEDGLPGKFVKEDVLVKDYLPKMKAICDKLEAANGKVLIVTDIKKDLGYNGSSSGHKAWREICSRMEKARIVEVFEAKVNNKFDYCLRLLKKISPKCFETNILGGDIDYKHQMKFGRKSQITDQLVELTLERQIYDLIDAAGLKGVTVMEVCKRLGIDQKRNYSRLVNMFTRFGMHLRAETHNKCNLYRVWTHGNFKPENSNNNIHKSKNLPNVIEITNNHIIDVDSCNKPAQATSSYGSEDTTLEVDYTIPAPAENGKMTTKVCNKSCADGESNLKFCLPQESNLQPTCSIPDVELSSENTSVEKNFASSMIPHSAMVRPSVPESLQRYPCLYQTVDNTRREQRILERLQVEKFILKGELYRWINDTEKDKSTETDRKTILRCINKLQREGHCKCIDINVPVVTNCGRTRVTQVVLHPSIEILSPQLLGEIHDKLRSFDNKVRGHGLTKLKNNESLPVLKDIQRTQNNMDSDIQAAKSEAMRANGFVLAKMVRAKLLHTFMWDYVNCSSDPSATPSSGIAVHDLKHPHTSCKLFLLEDVIRSIPIELFLQVVGATKRFDDMVEKCKKGLTLADLASEEYKHLMDTRATGRLSLIIDILRRLKLVRLVADSLDDLNNNGHATLQHALELKPYIEEPVSKDASTSLLFKFHDLRPRIRHDFILSSRGAVIEYWRTLEYCYAAADPRSAILAFPGSAVREVFLFRSWASIRVMTAEQRAELLDRVVMQGSSGNLSYMECEKIARELNLTLEQVLRVYYDRRQQRLNRFEGKSHKSQRSCKSFSSHVQKTPEDRPVKRVRLDMSREQVANPRLTTFHESSIESIDKDKQLPASSEEHGILLREIQDDDDHLESDIKFGPNEKDEAQCSIAGHFSSLKRKPTRQRRFWWTDETDRQLIIQYVRYRAALGAKYHRTMWSSIPNLPGPPSTCRKRMALLNGSISFRKLVMRLCNILGRRYVKHLEKLENASIHGDDHELISRLPKGKELKRDSVESIKNNCGMDLQEEQWDDFDDKDVKMALNDVLCHKKLAVLEASKRVRTYDNCSDSNSNGEKHESESVQIEGGQHKFSVRKSKSRRFHQRLMKILNGGHVSKEVYESLAVSNAVELFKLVFLSSSTSVEVPNLLTENLRRYSEHDLFSAFTYLREKKIMIGGNNGEPFTLSQNFLHSISKSPFPANTGERASNFSKFLLDRDKDLLGNGITLPADLQCGDIFHLFALVTSGSFSISSCLPDDGVGEPDDSRTLKRKVDSSDLMDVGLAKKLKPFPGEGEIISRREKGFPGIMISVCQTTISRTDVMELSNNWNCTNEQYFGESDKLPFTPTHNSISSDHNKILCDRDGVVPLLVNNCESPWENMKALANHLMSVQCDQDQVGVISPEVLKLIYSAIQLAGDQGLSMEEISQVANLQGEKLLQLIIDVLQMFQRVLKVNSFDTIRVVDALYRSKYFLTSIATSSQNQASPSSMNNVLGRSDNHSILHSESVGGTNSEKHIPHGDAVHKVTILNLPREVDDNATQNETCNKHECTPEHKTFLNINMDEYFRYSSCELNRPILPWINGDGTTNTTVYKGLRRRIFGIVMQNPGILEDHIIQRMNVLNPQSCKKLLEIMISDNHFKVRKMHQRTFSGPPSILRTFRGRSSSESKLVFREHFFANPMSTSLL